MHTTRTTNRRWLGAAAGIGLAIGGGFAGAPPTSATPALTVQVISVTTPVTRGSQGRLVVRTAPFAQCGASVQSQTAPARTIASLPSQTATAGGVITWTVQVPGIAKPGAYPVTVACRGRGQSVMTRLSIRVM